MMRSPHERVAIPKLSVRNVAALIGLSLAAAVALGESYHVLGLWISEPWLAAATLHTVLAVMIVAYWLRRSPALLRSFGPWQAYLPGVIVLLGCGAMALVSREFPGPPPGTGGRTMWPWLIWVPLVEELVFRAGIGQAFRRIAPGFWAAWFGALVFAMVHANPSLTNLLAGHVGLALGPFLLGLGCEALVTWSGRLGPAVALHAACNATVAVFAALDERWLGWLSPLYS